METRLDQIIVAYLLIIGIVSIIITVYDKLAAKKGKWRIPEKTLLLFGLFGGALPMYITMRLIRHKTLHKKFMLGLPCEFLFHITFLVWYFFCM